jgi:hypothetical protein
MTAQTKTDPICRSFRQDFPQFVERARSLGARISLSPGRRNGRDRVFWLDGYKQLTGYTTKKDGSRFTHDDAAANIEKALAAIEEDRRVMDALTVEERFMRVMEEFRQMKPQYRMIGEVRMPGGDRGHCFFMAEYDGGVSLHDIGEVAKAKAQWQAGETYDAQLQRFCAALEADFARRNVEEML